MVSVTKKQIVITLVAIAFVILIAWLIKNQVSDWPKTIDTESKAPEESIV